MIANQQIAALTAALLLATLALDTNAGTETERDSSAAKVKATASSTPLGADGKQVITITLDIDKGWHLYANPTDFKTTEPARTLVSVKAKNKLTAQVQYPTGKVHVQDGNTFKIYEDRVSIPVQVQRALGDTSPLEITVQLSACNDNVCYPSSSVLLTVP